MFRGLPFTDHLNRLFAANNLFWGSANGNPPNEAKHLSAGTRLRRRVPNPQNRLFAANNPFLGLGTPTPPGHRYLTEQCKTVHIGNCGDKLQLLPLQTVNTCFASPKPLPLLPWLRNVFRNF